MNQNYFLVGEAGSGKDTVAYLMPGYTAISFAAPLKKMVRVLREYPNFGPIAVMPMLSEYSGAFITSDYDTYDDYLEELRILQRIPQTTKDRAILQEFGTWAREIDIDIWVNAAIAEISRCKTPVVITDCRYKNEMDILEEIGLTGVAVLCDEKTRVKRLMDRDGECDTTRFNHPAEIEIRQIIPGVAIKIDNNGTMEHLRNQVHAKLLQGVLFDGDGKTSFIHTESTVGDS